MIIAGNIYAFATEKKARTVVFIFYTASYILTKASMTGWAFKNLWPDSVWLANSSLPVFMNCLILFGGIFYILYIHEDRRSIANIVITLIVVLFPAFLRLLLSFMLGYQTILKHTTVGLFISIIVVAISSLVFAIRGSRSGLFMLLGFVALLPGILLTSLTAFGIIPDVFITRWGFDMAVICLFILHSPLLKHLLEDTPSP